MARESPLSPDGGEGESIQRFSHPHTGAQLLEQKQGWHLQLTHLHSSLRGWVLVLSVMANLLGLLLTNRLLGY